MNKAFKLIRKVLPTKQELSWYQEFADAFAAGEIGEPQPDGGLLVTDSEDQNIKKMVLITKLSIIFDSVDKFLPAAFDYVEILQDDWQKELDALEKLREEREVLFEEREALLIAKRMLLLREELFTE